MKAMRAALAAGMLGFSVTGTPAFAHAHLHASDPSAGAKVAAPERVTLTFSEGVVPRFSAVTLQDSAGRPVASGPAQAGAAKTELVLPIKTRLGPGSYTVVWRAVSVDTHRTQGKFTFTVTP